MSAAYIIVAARPVMGAATNLLCFGCFEIDPKGGELREKGEVVHLAPQPFKVLALLASRSGEIVSRDELREELWRDSTFVDFDQGVNFCIRQIRQALGDHADAPQYIETLPRRGYRFLAPVDMCDTRAGRRAVTRAIVLPFRMLRPDPETEFLAFSLPDAITNALSGFESLVMRSSLVASRFAGEQPDPKRLAAEADVDVVLAGSLIRSGQQLRVSTQLTEVPAGTLLWSHTWQVGFGDLFQVEDELTNKAVEALALPLSSRDQALMRRDVPASGNAYEYYLRANQLSQDPKQWSASRDLYLRCVTEDPRYAPAWARLGRIYHVMGKYLESGTPEQLQEAESAFRRALAVNPELPLGHKLYAQLEVDLGRARDAMVRLLDRTRSADPDVFAGLVSACRYCGLLDASVAAYERARRLDHRARTSIGHTWFVRGEYDRVVTLKLEEVPYIGALSLAAVGRREEAVASMRALEEKTRTRFRDFMIAARALLEDRREESVAAVRRIVDSNFVDPEGLFYLTRHLAHLGEPDAAVRVFQRVVEGGYSCYPAIARDPWLDPLRGGTEFTALVRRVRDNHADAARVFEEMRGGSLLGAMPSVQAVAPRPRKRSD